ncbi:MAG: hypothetical protein HKUEN02_09860 [Anaerolineaceae bacterium]|nr:MAG: hypothetical protein HKUEN02_09860 [Anaerolineaceae bacterium]
MQKKIAAFFIAALVVISCAISASEPAATQTSEVSETSDVLIPTPTQTPASMPTITVTPESVLPSYGEIDPTVADKFKAEGINIPEELNNPEYGLDMKPSRLTIVWTQPYEGIDIPIGVIPEEGIATGKYHIKGIWATEGAWKEIARGFLRDMWIRYRELGNPADREITLEQYVELLKAGRGGFEIPQYNPETGFFDKKAMVNPLAGYSIIISDNDELPLKRSTENSALFYVDTNGMVWIAGNDLEFKIEQWMNPDENSPRKNKPYENGPNLAYALIRGISPLGVTTNECLATDHASASCLRDSAKMDDKYWDPNTEIVLLYKEWLKKYEAGDHNAQPPLWIDD